MPLDPLATAGDLAARVGPLSPDQLTRAGALLTDASAAVRSFCRQDFTLVTDDEVVLRPVGNDLVLPQRPVIAVTAVRAVRRDGTPSTGGAGWSWDGLDRVRVAGLGWRTAIEWDLELDGTECPARTYSVTYDHGYEQAPDDVIGIVCGMVNRVLVAPTMVEGMQAERAGPFSYQLGQGSSSPGPAVRLSEADKAALVDAGYRRKAGTVQLHT